ncbi:hypothetical protein A0256_16655 [Mucilaginibacter sp. PAMC 26640]|nr:hypothetical protein A0256_16655 [Mucilaginibacter sp. PAMC 26640]
MVLNKIILCISLCTFTIGSYLIWFDRKNVFNHALIGVCFVAYIVPICIIDFDLVAPSEIVRLYFNINVIGGIFFVFGLLLGFKWKKVKLVDSVMQFSLVEGAITSSVFETKILRISRRFFLFSIVVMILCFAYMGYLPMFANDPYSAKQFKGIYQPRYQHVALFYRTSKQFVQILLPFFLIDFYDKRKISTLLLILTGMTLVLVSLSRSETVTGLLLIISIIISMKASRLVFISYMVFIVIFFSIGSSFWVIASYFFPNSGFVSLVDGQTAADIIASGAPDIMDQLGFLNAFVNNHVDYTYGLTFFGALIPFNFKWNPSVWTLAVLNDTDDISAIASGGLRLPVSLWGYVCFGWFGVAVIPFFSAFFTGYILKKIKRIVDKLRAGYKGYIIFYYLVFLYLNIALVFTDFYRISIYLLPAFIFFYLVVYKKKKSDVITIKSFN